MGKKTYIWILDDPAVASLPPGWWLLRVLLHRWTVIAQARTRRTWVRSHGWGPWHIRTPPLVTSLIGISLELVEDNSSCKASIAHDACWHTLKNEMVTLPITAIGRYWQIRLKDRNGRNDRVWRISRRMLGNPEEVSHWHDPTWPTLW